jgi:hypothetical protein
MFIACIAILGMFFMAQSSYAYQAMANLNQQTDGTDVVKKVEDTVKNTQDGKKLASNATVFGADLISELQGNKAVAEIKLNGADLNSVVSNVTSPVDYIIGMASVRLAGADVTKDGNAYNFSDSTVNPVLFSEKFVTGEKQPYFIGAVSVMPPSQIAVIVAINMTPEEIKKSIEDKVDMGKVIIVQALTTESQQAYNTLFDEYKEGFSLKTLDNNNPNVIKALQGTI